jgi:hypothetical protein
MNWCYLDGIGGKNNRYEDERYEEGDSDHKTETVRQRKYSTCEAGVSWTQWKSYLVSDHKKSRPSNLDQLVYSIANQSYRFTEIIHSWFRSAAQKRSQMAAQKKKKSKVIEEAYQFGIILNDTSSSITSNIKVGSNDARIMETLKNTLIDTGIAYDLLTYQVAIDWSSERSTGGYNGSSLEASAIVYPLGWFCVKAASLPILSAVVSLSIH